jgi:surface carbohydrate biosynthesis protein (TIGR04326 family)
MTDAAGAQLLLWAADTAPPEHPNVVLWQGGAGRPGARSIVTCVNTEATEIRRRYLAWAHDLGDLVVGRRKLRERFVFTQGASLWHQTVFVEQSPWTQRSVETILKVLAFDAIVARERPAAVTFVGSDRNVSAVLEGICRQRRIRYAWSRKRSASPLALRAVLQRTVPRFLRGFVWLMYLAATRITLRPPRAPDVAADAPRVLICGPFSNHNATECLARGGEFQSRFWPHLPRLLVDHGFHVQWLHYFFAGERAIPDMSAGRRLIARLNVSRGANGSHALVDSYLTPAGLWRIFTRWLAISIESTVVGWVLRGRFRDAAQESYWPLIRDDWANTLRGAALVENLFFAECFDRALATLPRHEHCIYLMENQPWERALARAWHRHGHGQLAAVAHSTIRFWDLRYHCDPRRYDAEHRRSLPGPDVVVLNGPAARAEYLATAAKRETLADCEALRYLHLLPGTPRAIPEDGAALHVLVLGDFRRQATDELVQLTLAARSSAEVKFEILIKPHPICPLGPEDYAGLDVTVVNEIVSRLVPRVHAVVASNTTSSAVEAYVSGGRVLVRDTEEGVNYSPLRQVEGVAFVRTPAELAAAIDRLAAGRWQQRSPQQRFFNIDAGLSGWRRYFGIAQPASHTGESA